MPGWEKLDIQIRRRYAAMILAAPSRRDDLARNDRMLLVQWLFQTLITPPSQRSARLAYPMHDSLVAVAGAVGVGVISWYLKQIRKDRIVPVVSPTGWSIMRAVTSPCRPAPWARHLPLRRAASEGNRGSSASHTTEPNLAGAISSL